MSAPNLEPDFAQTHGSQTAPEWARELLGTCHEGDKKKEKAQREKEKGDKKGKKGDKGGGKGKGKSKGNDIDRSRLACLNLAHWGTCERHKKGECQYNHTDAVIKKFKDSKHWKPSVEAYNNMKSQGCTQWNPGKAGKP